MKVRDVALIIDNDCLHEFPTGSLVEIVEEDGELKAYGLDNSKHRDTWWVLKEDLFHIGVV